MRWLLCLLALAPVLAPAPLVSVLAEEVAAYRTLAAQGLRVQQRLTMEEVSVGTELLIAEREHGKLVLRPSSTRQPAGGSPGKSSGARVAARAARGVEVPICMAGPDTEVSILDGRRRRYEVTTSPVEADFPLRTCRDEVVESTREWRGRRRRVSTLQSVLREYRELEPAADLMSAATLLELVNRDRLDQRAHDVEPTRRHAVALVAATWFTVVAHQGRRVLDVRSDSIVAEQTDFDVDADAPAPGSTASDTAILLREQLERCLDQIYHAAFREAGLELLVTQEALLPRVETVFPGAAIATLGERLAARPDGHNPSSVDRRMHTKWQGPHHRGARPTPQRPTWGMIDFPSPHRARRRRAGRSAAAGAVLMPVAASLAVTGFPGFGQAGGAGPAASSTPECHVMASTGQGDPTHPEGQAPPASQIADTHERALQPPERAPDGEVGEPVEQMEVSAPAAAAEPGDVPGPPGPPEPRFAFAGTGTTGEGERVWYFVDGATRRVVAVTSDAAGDDEGRSADEGTGDGTHAGDGDL